MKLYFVRHGESTANLLREFSNSGFKHPLTEAGVEQARLVAHSLSGLQVERIYSSPVMRAVQTAQILGESLMGCIASPGAEYPYTVDADVGRVYSASFLASHFSTSANKNQQRRSSDEQSIWR